MIQGCLSLSDVLLLLVPKCLSKFYSVLQLVPVSNRTKNIPERKGSLANYDLVFQVSLPALGYSTYFIKMSTSKLLSLSLF